MVEFSAEQAHNLTNALLTTIGNVYQECVASQRRRDVAPTSPLATERQLLGNEDTDNAPADQELHFLGRAAASRAEVAASHALAAILRLLRHPDEVGPATAALYPLARTAIEGAAIAHYLLDADISLDQRLLRTAQILVWSEQNRLAFFRDFDDLHDSTDYTPEAEKEWAELEDLLRTASITPTGRGDKPWQKLTRGTDSIGRFQILRLTHRMGADTSLLYRTLSGVAHHAPWITEMYTQLTITDENGAYYGTQISQAEQVDLVANVCHALLTAAVMKARFYGATTDRLDELANSSRGFFTSLTRTLFTMEQQG